MFFKRQLAGNSSYGNFSVLDFWKYDSDQTKMSCQRGHPWSTDAKFPEKLNIFNPLIRTRTRAYQGVRNVTFSENFAYLMDDPKVN